MKGVDASLVTVVRLAIRRTPIDFGVADKGGLRTAQEQYQLYMAGASQCDGFVKLSKHQSGEAVDLIPFVGNKAIDNKEMMCVVAGVMFSCASEVGIRLRWGLDWNQNGDIRDNKFNDMYHFEKV